MYKRLEEILFPTYFQSASKFNDPNHPSQILVVTYATCSTGLNMHIACSAIVMVEPATSVNLVLQVIALVHRLGKCRRQRIWILVTANTFDLLVEFNQARKMLGQIIGMGYQAFSDLDLSRGKEEDMSDDNSDAEQSDNADQLEKRVDEFLRAMLGQPSSRLEWDDIHNIGLTDSELKQMQRLTTQIPNQVPIAKNKETLAIGTAKKQLETF
ncbi:hypothetical protein VTN77DRAFT_9144 [Rasamsonia byssochlamydoides]|uniref:uncharacterized protein n=1 Tax=Rasamsonia byssochlamydoides TaxID=89139 RepID=UPI003742A53B